MPTKFRELEEMLRDAGWTFHHATGSHYIFTHPTRGRVTVPFHGRNSDIAPGTLRDILKRTGIVK